MIIAGCADGTVHLWDVKNPSRAKTVLTADGSNPVTFVTSAPAITGEDTERHRELLMARVGGHSGRLLLWDMKTLPCPM